MVVRTGFMTLKGGLVRDILFPKPSKFKFYTDSLKFVGILACLAIFADCFTIPSEIEQGVSTWHIVDNALDIITVTVPPALPAAMTAGGIYSANRLANMKINCISPPRINVSGRVQVMVFDKTGTLTEDGLELLGYRPSKLLNKMTVFSDFVESISKLSVSDIISRMFIESICSCHAITRVKDRLIGDPLDVKMF